MNQQRLIVCGRELSNERTLSDYGIFSGNETEMWFHLVLRLLNGARTRHTLRRDPYQHYRFHVCQPDADLHNELPIVSDSDNDSDSTTSLWL